MLRLTCILLGIVTTTLASLEGFIVGGNFANIDQHPHSAFLSVSCVSDRGKKENWICGSSILNQRILLTAGHCLNGCTYQSHIGVSLGDAVRTSGVSHVANSFVVHENYNSKTSANDVCLIRVARKINLNWKVSRVAIMKKPPYNEKAIVAGWGMTNEYRETFTNRLKFVSQSVWSRNQCLQIFRYLVKGAICAANDNPSDYAAQGDSGSALVVRSYIQIGLVSYKIPAISKSVVIYTDVGYFYDWIRAYAKKLACI